MWAKLGTWLGGRFIRSALTTATNYFRTRSAMKHDREMADARWEAQALRAAANSWKDEFWTILIGMPIIVRIAGVFWEWATGDFSLSNAGQEMIRDVDDLLGGNYHVIVLTCVTASFGVRLSDKLIGSGAAKRKNGGAEPKK